MSEKNKDRTLDEHISDKGGRGKRPRTEKPDIKPTAQKKEENNRETPEDPLDTKLVHGILNDNLDEVKEAIEQGADIHTDHDCVLTYAVLMNNLDMVKYLVENGCEVNVSSCVTPEEPLTHAALMGHLEFVKYLVEAGADVSKLRDSTWRHVRESGYDDVEDFLLQYKDDKE